MKGVVKFYNDKRSYGFITGEDDTDIFVHRTGLERQGLRTITIAEGDNVEYETKESDRGLVAINVKKIEAEEDQETKETEKPVEDQETKPDEDEESKKPVEKSTTA